jgi:two-component system, LytTR family, response regulator
MTVSILVVDDEPLARRKLAALIAEVDGFEQIGEATDGAMAIEAVARLRPDIVFLDIQMPEFSGVEVVQRLHQLPEPPAVVFTTAHDEYAVAAFELEAIDYLVKPFGRERFRAALKRARQALDMRDAATSLDRAGKVLAAPEAALERIFVRDRNAVVPLALNVIERLEAQDDYVMIHAQGRRYLVRLRIADLEARLPNPPFRRVHRSHIVNMEHVKKMITRDDSRFEVLMAGGARVPMSRVRSQELRRLTR